MEKIPPLGATDPNTPYIDGNVAAGIEGNPVPAQFFNHVNAELVNVIEDAELTPDAEDLTQLSKAIRALIEKNKTIGKNIGEVYYHQGRSAPFGAVVADGGLIRRDMYPDLWAFAQAQNLVVTEAAWQVQSASQGSVGVYSSGDGTTTFRLPLLTDYLRGAADSAKVGTWLKPSVVPVDWTKSAASVCGIYNNIDDNKATSDKLYGLEPILNEALYTGAAVATQSPGNQVSASATLYSAIRPATTYMLPCIHACNAVIPDAQADMHAMMAALNGKLDTATYNDCPMFFAAIPASSIPAATYTRIPLSTPVIDTHGSYSSGGYFKPKVPGYYLITASYMSLTIAAAGTHHVSAPKNGGIGMVVGGGATGPSGGSSVSAIMQMNGTTDYVSYYIYSNVASTIPISYGLLQAFLIRGV